jgi:hypothetical protein
MGSPSQTNSQERPWYHEGLQFSCSQCGDCCTGAPGYVWVNKAEIAALAVAVCDGDVEQFEAMHVRKVGIRKSLREFSDGACVLFDRESRKCTVYGERPRQCRTWPFWESNLRTPEDWRHTCEVCPGSGQGELHQLETIEQSRTTFRV